MEITLALLIFDIPKVDESKVSGFKKELSTTPYKVRLEYKFQPYCLSYRFIEDSHLSTMNGI